MLRRIGSNAIANVVNGLAVAVFQFSMTAIVAKSGDTRQLALWALAASIAGFAPLLSCNIAAVVTRRLSDPDVPAHQFSQHSAMVLREAKHLSRQLTLACLVLAVLLVFLVQYIYPVLLAPDIWSSAMLIGIFFAGSCWVVFAQPEQGWLMSSHRNWAITVTNICVRVSAVTLFYLALIFVRWPFWVATVLCSLALWCGPLLMRKIGSIPGLMLLHERNETEARKIFKIARGLGIWGFTSAMTQTATIPLVAFITPTLSSSMFLAYTLVGTIIGVIGAIAGAMIAPIARLLSQSDKRPALKLTETATLILWALFTCGALCIYFVINPLMKLWVGHALSDQHYILFFILFAMQHGLRSTALAVSMALAMGAESRVILMSPFIEAACVLFVALPVAFLYGPHAFLLSLCAAGSLGAIATSWFAATKLLSSPNEKSQSLRLLMIIIALQVATVMLWGGLAMYTEL
jgi:O-antigen/teichoic acid export membrane protein